MRIVCISDTHTMHDKITLPAGDVLIHAGDFSFHGYKHEVEPFNRWLGTLPFMHKIVIAGNHDTSFQDSPLQAQSWLYNCTYLEDSGVEVEVDGKKLKIWGAPWQPYFCNWAFNLRTPEELKSKWDLIPKDTDILVTHGPPHRVGDTVPRYEGKEYVGCRELRKAIQRVKPKLHVCGHIHEGYGVRKLFNTICANASVCNRSYKPIQEPLVFELGDDGTLRQTSQVQGEEETQE